MSKEEQLGHALIMIGQLITSIGEGVINNGNIITADQKLGLDKLNESVKKLLEAISESDNKEELFGGDEILYPGETKQRSAFEQ